MKNDKVEEIQNIIKDVKVEDIEVELNKEVNQYFKDNMKFVSSEFGITRNVPLNSKFVEKTTPTLSTSSTSPAPSSETTSNIDETKEENNPPKKEETTPETKEEEKNE